MATIEFPALVVLISVSNRNTSNSKSLSFGIWILSRNYLVKLLFFNGNLCSDKQDPNFPAHSMQIELLMVIVELDYDPITVLIPCAVIDTWFLKFFVGLQVLALWLPGFVADLV